MGTSVGTNDLISRVPNHRPGRSTRRGVRARGLRGVAGWDAHASAFFVASSHGDSVAVFVVPLACIARDGDDARPSMKNRNRSIDPTMQSGADVLCSSTRRPRP